ncbi:hypothetical protein BJY04DRAFT_187837 [Aspergillus karnatakaensis]|uniref:uncharacterized protein n=1 Tax=Aspergillus karnatakaensis TaxID=1810916 RepID=UPI003CCDC850
MTYNAVSQADHELASDSEDSRGPSPQPHHHLATFEQLPLDADNIGGGRYLQRAKTDEDNGNGVRSLGSMIRSMTAASYDMVEEDDYEVVAAPPTGSGLNSPSSPNVSPRRAAAPDAGPTEDRAELRTPTTDHSVPLSHPTPGLQSLQGAYLQNVERLEKSAERLSLSSADIGSEIRKMDLEQKRRSSSSASNYVSQDGFSRRGSIQSASRLGHLSEQQTLGEVPEDSTARLAAHPYLPPLPEPVPLTTIDLNPHSQYHLDPSDADVQRPSSAASGDTFRQARALFTDFDGVHYVPIDRVSELGRRLSLTRPPLASRSEPYKQPQEGENMVFYPAPVPMMLNLPPKLSQRPDQAEREKRRTQLLDVVSSENRKSAPWLAEQDQPADGDRRRTKHLSDLPSQLRASVFFETPSKSLDIDPGQTSAVATLDSILDASTTAPVTAFTDHPFAGPMGSEVYGSSKHGKLPKEVVLPREVPRQRNKLRRKSALDLNQQSSDPDFRSSFIATHTLYPTTEIQAADTHETTSLHRPDKESASNSEDNSTGSSESSESSEDDPEEELQFTGPPATLLAELEQRKHDLKLRRRTAANAGGMHSTLLQLEAVAAKQSEHRRQKPVALAWENPDAHQNEHEDDDDVPLAILFPEKGQAADEARPLGLMEKREMEESEPLSRRRARLRGEPLPQALPERPMTMYSQMTQGPPAQAPEQDSGDEGETLGQRLKRLRGHERQISKADTDFTTEILAEFDHMKDDGKNDSQNGPPQEDETLAQRRARLRKEAAEKRNSGLKIPRYRRSMADVLHAPRPSTGGQPSLQQEAPGPHGPIHQRSMQQLHVSARPPQTAGGFSNNHSTSIGPYGYGMPHPNTFYSDAILGNRHLSYAMPPNFRPNAIGQVIEPGQRDVIDRWRQSIA